MNARSAHPLATAAQIISDRAKAHPYYAEALRQAEALAVSRAAGKDVMGLKALGGFTEICRAALDEVIVKIGADRVHVGSKLLPYTLADILKHEVHRLRERVQVRRCREGFVMICGAIFRDSTRTGPEAAKDRRCTLDASHRSRCDHDGPPVCSPRRDRSDKAAARVREAQSAYSRDEEIRASKIKCPDRDDGGEHEFAPDVEYDATNPPINCMDCGQTPAEVLAGVRDDNGHVGGVEYPRDTRGNFNPETGVEKTYGDSLKIIAEALRASLLQQATAHGVSMTETQASAIANNMTNVAIEAVQDEFGSSGDR